MLTVERVSTALRRLPSRSHAILTRLPGGPLMSDTDS
jgi:hypothetical protein